MSGSLVTVTCSDCSLTWRFSILNWQVGKPLACPFCSNQHFHAPSNSEPAEATATAVEQTWNGTEIESVEVVMQTERSASSTGVPE